MNDDTKDPIYKEPWQMTLQELSEREARRYVKCTIEGEPYSSIWDPNFKKNLKRKRAELKKLSPERVVELVKEQWRSYHREAVEGALLDGKTAPANVMADYADFSTT